MTDIWVEEGGERFIVRLDFMGKPKSIKKRAVHAPGKPWEAIYNKPFWHHSLKPSKRAARILEIVAANAPHLPKATECIIPP